MRPALCAGSYASSAKPGRLGAFFNSKTILPDARSGVNRDPPDALIPMPQRGGNGNETTPKFAASLGFLFTELSFDAPRRGHEPESSALAKFAFGGEKPHVHEHVGDLVHLIGL